MEKTDTPLPPPYGSFQTFLTALDYLQEHGVPGKVDRSALPTFNGIKQGQILGALRFFDLIDSDFLPRRGLPELADKKTRKETLAKLLEGCYPKVFAIGLATASPSQFDSATSELKAQGDTLVKARTFFLKAAAFAEIPLSGHLTRRKPRRPKGEQGRRTPKPKTGSTQTKNGAPNDGGGGSERAQYEKRVNLPDVGGSLTVSGSFNPFDLAGRERDLVNRIVDELKKFEADMEKAGD